MQTRRDQLHAYRFLTKRALAALVTGQPNAVEPPLRRLTVTTVSGLMIAVLVGAGFALFGFLKPSAGDSWQDGGTIIVENDTGRALRLPARQARPGRQLHLRASSPSRPAARRTRSA